jgi:flagellar biosynthetic protein FliQ
MTTNQAIDVVRETLALMLLLSLPVLLAALAMGLAVSIFQAMTQIQEQTLSFVPKIIAMGVMAIVALPWITMRILDFSARMFGGF